MTKIDVVQVNLIYLIFNSSNFLVDTNVKWIQNIRNIQIWFKNASCKFFMTSKRV